MIASSNGQEDAAQFLLHAGADPHLQHVDGQTAFEYGQENSDHFTVKVLVDTENYDTDMGHCDDTAAHEGMGIDTAAASVLSIPPEAC